ncbi:protein FAR1-RELATED SEQUENCE 5-like [Camellia sinensis]|uniref:protein FAR1-RELATED SEQUENCE 5-like n=1 Tax=Camellia sinensis TaxID=4442 RepID=UPI001035BD57|nr:protein FAR1-RELATED SEQUENCE 5-like [Camellia sinensis]
MDIDSNNPTLSGSEEVEELENNSLLNESGEIEEPKKGMCFTSKQEVHEFYAKYAKNLGFAIAYRTHNIGADGKRIRTPVKRRLEINDEVGIGVSRNFHSIVVKARGCEALTFDERDSRNHIENARRLRLGVGDAKLVAFYFHRMQQENSNFYSAIDFDVDGRIRNLFWADARSRAAYKAFGDVVSFDTTYLINKYDMLFAPFVGVNHHGQSIFFGYGLLCNENMETFVWLFKEWLKCMSATPPKAIITDQCRAMQNAIEFIFPQGRHRWCLWHIMKKIPKKLRGYSQYEAIKFALQNAVYDSFTKDEFDEEWKTMIEKFSHHENEWLGVLYGERHRWIPTYYDNALKSKVEKETKADFKSRNKLYDCLTVYEFEKQFRAAYTNVKFKEVQGRKMGQGEPRKLNFGCTDSMEDNTYDRAQDSALQMVDKIRSVSLSESGMGNIDGSTFVDLSIDVDPNAPCSVLVTGSVNDEFVL